MSRFILHKKTKEKICLKYLMTGIACILTAGAVCFAVHSIGTARAKSREVVLIYTQEELEQYLLDQESEEYNRNGRYRLEEDLDLGGLYQSIGTNIEPFTGTFDGNGHVISGLARPLFGVMEHARVENLFLSETVLTDPFTYYDGENYVDGYGALAAYAVDSVIQNCGMSGEIWTASPAEAEYQLAKASPAEAEEGAGPGMADDSLSPPVGENPQENTSTAGPANDGTDDSTTRSEPSDGPGVESPETGSLEETKESEGAASDGQEESSSGGGQSDSDGSSDIEMTDGEKNESTEGSTEGNTPETSKPEDGGESTPETREKDSEPAGGGEDISTDSEPAGGREDISTDSKEAGGTDTSSNHDWTEHESNTPVDSGPKGESVAAALETIGYRAIERRHLMMKIPAVLDSDAEAAVKASPSDATPSDAEGPVYDEADASKENQAGSEDETVREETESTEYIGNPNGDIYILVTAGRVTAGGLVAQTSGATLISDCFALVEMGSHLETVETYAGGFAGIIGDRTRVGNSYASGLTDSDDVTGGFVAVNEGIIENSYSSMSVGTAGTIRDAFTALGSGRLSGCVYDRQMACAEAAKEELPDIRNMEMEEKDTATPADVEPALSEVAGFSLRGQNTADMTGPEAQMPGNWYRTANAYPQIEHFALTDHDMLVANSRASAIALLLPDGVTLVNILSEEEITLPSDVDGQQIEWKAEGGIGINESNQVIVEKAVFISNHDVPEVGSVLESSSTSSDPLQFEAVMDEVLTETLAEPQTEPQTEPGAEQSVPANTPSDPVASEMKLKASINGITKNYALAVAAPQSTGYTTWDEVGQAMAGSGIPGYDVPILVDGYYEIWNGTQLAWFAAKINQGNTAWNARLMSDIDLFGREHNGYTGEPVMANISNAMRWTPIGSLSQNYEGIFDGNFHEVDGLYINGGGNIGLFGRVKGAIIKNLGIGANSRVHATANFSALFVGGSDGGSFLTITNCYNFGTLTYTSGAYHKGTYLGDDVGVGIPNTCNITYCFNGGNTPNLANVSNGTVQNCFADVSVYSGNGGSSAGGVTRITTKEMAQSWALSYALNGERMDGVWKYTPGEYPGFGALDRPSSWQDVGQGVIDGLVTGITLAKDSNTGAYHIGSAEQLAAFAARVNSGAADFQSGNVNLMMDINLAGERYGGTIASPIPWCPIGDESHVYKGIFDGGGKSIGYMTVERDGYAGMFGCAGGGAVITGVGIDSSCKITSTGTASGNGTAALVGLVKSNETAVRQIMIQNCYSRATVTSAGTASATGAFVGNYSGTPGGSEKISNCYNTGMIKVSGGSAGAAAGTFFHGTDGGIKNCYWDSETSGSVLAAVIAGGARVENCSGKTTAAMKSDDPSEILDPLNANLGTGTWCRVDKRNDGYPIFMKSESEVTWEDVGAAVMAPRSKNSSSTPGTKDDPYQIWTAEELAWFACQVNQVSGKTGLCAELMADINLFGGLYSGHAYDPNAAGYLSKALLWEPIGNSPGGSAEYVGTFHGNGHTVSGMRVGSTTASYQGLFGVIGDNTEIASLTVGECQIVGKEYLGGIAGCIKGSGITIKDCKFTGKISGDSMYVGGIAGLIRGTETVITRCRNSGEIECIKYVGGIAGVIDSGGSGELTITECWNSGNVTGKNTSESAGISGGVSGGIVGWSNITSGRVVLDGCYNSGSVSAGMPGSYSANAGGIVGLDYRYQSSNIGTLAVRNCYNQGTVYGNSETSSYNHCIGGIAGGLTKLSEVKGCYNTGQVTGTGSQFRSIAGSNDGTGNITNCYYQTGCPADPNAKEVSEAGLKTWGAAFALNGEQLSQSTGIAWSYTEGNYPIPSETSLRDAADWEDVGEAAYYGLLDGAVPVLSGTSYQIGNAKQMAWFAYQVNEVRSGISADGKIDGNLTADIDMEAEEGRYVSSGRLPWIPIGKLTAKKYSGIFQSYDAVDSWKIFRIYNLYVDYSDTENLGGLFGTIHGGKVTGIGLEGASVIVRGHAGNKYAYAGGISGAIVNGTIISRCYSRKGSSVETIVNENVNNYAGGIVGTIEGNSRVEHCYHMDSSVTGGQAYSYAGGIAGYCTQGSIQNCYNAGTLIVPTADRAGSIAGGINTSVSTNKVSQCYSTASYNADTGHGYTVEALTPITDTDVKIQAQADALNTVGGIEKKENDRIWFTSLETEETRGLPTFAPPEMINLGATDPASGEEGVNLVQNGVLDIPDARLRSVHQETDGDISTVLTKWDTDSFYSYGSKSANGKIGLQAKAAESTGTVLDPAVVSLVAPTQDMGILAQLTLYTGAAYTCPLDKKFLIEVSSGTTRYEIRFTINKVESKSLVVDLPAEVGMVSELTPDGSSHTTYSNKVVMKNSQSYPMAGSIVSATPVKDREGYRELKPVAKNMPVSGGQIYETGVWLGIDNPDPGEGSGILSGPVYYNPDAPDGDKRWMTYQLKGGGSFQYRYFLEYEADSYYDIRYPNFGYIVKYQFGVMEDDYTAAADAVAD